MTDGNDAITAVRKRACFTNSTQLGLPRKAESLRAGAFDAQAKLHPFAILKRILHNAIRRVPVANDSHTECLPEFLPIPNGHSVS
jgi:hypothetical protein